MIRTALLLLAACAETPGPRLVAAEPTAVVAGGTVTLTGSRLCGADDDCASAGGAIVLGYDTPVVAMILAYAPTFAQVRVPSIAPAGKTVFIATVNERSSNALDFEILAP